MRVSESQFADDVAVYGTTRDALEMAARELIRTADECGFTVSLKKTKLLATS